MPAIIFRLKERLKIHLSYMGAKYKRNIGTLIVSCKNDETNR